MTEMFGEAWSPMSVPDLAPDDDDDFVIVFLKRVTLLLLFYFISTNDVRGLHKVATHMKTLHDIPRAIKQ